MTDDFPYPLTREQTVMQHVKVEIEQRLSRETLLNLDGTDVSVVFDDAADQFVARLSAYVLSDRLASGTLTDTVLVPASPWQHFKQEHQQSWWLGWLVRRRPVRYDAKTLRVNVERIVTFPRSTFHVPDHRLGEPVVFDRVKQSAYWEET